MIYVVGSGPAGVSCARALLDRGCTVTMLDGGVELDATRRAMLDVMQETGPDRWTPQQLSAIKHNMTPVRGQVPLKRAYGSDFAFQDTDRLLPMTSRGADVRPSLARGGLSNVWGATMLPYRSQDLAAWPITLEDLAPHYRAVTGFVPLSATEDDLTPEFPLYSDRAAPLVPSRQAQALMHDLRNHRDALVRDGYRYGYARLAVRATASAHDPGCVYCGLCLYGCPYGLIYNSAETLSTLQTHPRFTYIEDVVVRRVREEGSRVLIHAESLSGKDARTFEGRHAYLACGVLATTRIVLESTEAYDRPVALQDSQYFIVPMLRYARVTGARRERLHTLAQVFMEIENPDVSRHNIHLQIYSYNDLYDHAIGGAWLPKRLGNIALERLFVVQGYLHSRESAPIAVRLERPAQSGPRRLRLDAEPHVASRQTIGRITRSLSKHRRELRAVALRPFVQVCPSGRGYHCGGTLPMRAAPGPLETNALGRLHGFERLHIVDASCLPDIPSSPITFTVLANAHRIGSAVPA